MGFSPFDPQVWGAFLGFAALTWLTVRAFHARNKDYPGTTPEDDA